MSDEKKKRRTWITVVVAILVVFVVLGIAVVGGAAFWFRRHVDTTFTSSDAANVEFEQQRARFAGQQPLIEVGENERPIVHKRKSSTELQSLRVLVFDAQAGKLVRISVPFWLLKLAPSRQFNFNTAELDFDTDRFHLTMEDVERAGPGLLLDTRKHRTGGQLLVWTE